jgi:hypothetical protein
MNKRRADFVGTNSVGVQSEGAAEGGGWGEKFRRARAESPAALLGESRPPKKSFVFLLEKKSGARK